MPEAAAAGRRPRRVLYLSTLPPPGGGIATWTRILMERGLPGGFEPALVDTRFEGGRRIYERGRATPAELRRSARILSRLAVELLRRRPALLHANVDPYSLGFYRDLLALGLARAFRVPVVLHYHGHVSAEMVRARGRLRRPVLRLAARLAAANVALNEPSLAYLRALVGERHGRTLALPNFYDERSAPPRPPEPRREGEPARVAYAGILKRAKGAPVALEVARRLPDTAFEFFGPVADELAELARGAPPNVRLHGEVDHASLVDRLRSCHALLFPSASEGFPYAVLEAMAVGLPVVATPVGAIPEMIEEGRGGSLRPADAGALAEALRALLGDDTQRVEMGRFNQEKSRRLYAYAAVAERWAALYEALCAGAAPGGERS